MATVYLGEDTTLLRKVAIKIPRVNVASRSETDRFLREARIAARFSHPSLCPVFDVGILDGTPYFVMPYLEGHPLSRATLRNWEPRPALELIERLADALQVLHHQGILHRDVKPGNVMLQPDGTPVIMDFGISRAVLPEMGSRLTLTGQFIGTPAYVAPEVLEDPGRADLGPTVDVYSLGVILFELLTGRQPFVSRSVAALFADILHLSPPAPSSLIPGLSPAVDAICLRALARKPEDRFGSMREFEEAIRRCLDGLTS